MLLKLVKDNYDYHIHTLYQKLYALENRVKELEDGQTKQEEHDN